MSLSLLNIFNSNVLFMDSNSSIFNPFSFVIFIMFVDKFDFPYYSLIIASIFEINTGIKSYKILDSISRNTLIKY
jgi:hypothetical protein